MGRRQFWEKGTWGRELHLCDEIAALGGDFGCRTDWTGGLHGGACYQGSAGAAAGQHDHHHADRHRHADTEHGMAAGGHIFACMFEADASCAG